eukprot:s5332_g4.t1
MMPSKSRRVQTPLRRRLQQYIAMIDSQNPRPQPCDRGASRAAFRLFELFEFFQAFIKFRTMYYIDPNLAFCWQQLGNCFDFGVRGLRGEV